MSTEAVIVFASFFPKPGQEDAVEQLLRGMTTPTRQEPGCQTYDLYRSAQAPVSFHLFERYRDQAALDAHRNTEHYKAYRARIPELLADPIKVQVLQGLDVRA